MKTNDSINACPKCGAPVPAEAPQGLCPACVFAQASAPEPAPTATSQIPSLERLAVAFPQLQVIELIGRGGMGFVFKARQPHLDRFVALKLLPDSLAHDPQFAERFNREGRVLARLNHPNIVSIFDFGQAGGFYYLMMEYVDGVNLRQAMQAGKFSPSEALAIVPKICEALQFAHEEGILHRDIKPENILLDARGRVKIADFGIAKLVGEEHSDVSLTATGAALGTMHYMAPEQIEKPGTVDHRADIYSLGVVFYELLTGELPIGRFSPPSQRTPVDPRVDDVVMRTLEKEREKRFQSAGEMKTNVEHLTEVGAGTFKGARPERGPHGTMVINPSAVIPPVPKWSLKSVWAAVLTGLSLPPLLLIIVLALVGGGGLGIWEIILLLGISCPFGLGGTILGWTALSDIRAHQGQLRGLPLAVFAALTWPLLVLVGGTLMIPWIVLAEASAPGTGMPLGAVLMLLVPVGTVTFAIWAVYVVWRWGANQPASPRRGVLKWVFLALMLFGIGVLIVPKLRPVRQVQHVNNSSSPVPVDTDATPWIRFTFTAVELREVKGVRWLAIDYLDEAHGEVDKSFPWEATIPGHRPETRTSEALLGDTNAPVRHQRVEYRMPDSMERDVLEKFRDEVAKTLNNKSFRLEPGEEKELFELVTPEGGSLKARIKAMPPMKLPERPAPAAQLEDRIDDPREKMTKREQALQFRLVADDSDTAAPVDVMMESRRDGTSFPLRVLRTVLLDGSAVARAGIVLETDGHRTIAVELTAEGARQFGAFTAANVNRQLAIVAGSRVLSAPIIRSAITEDQLNISGAMSAAEVHKLVAELNGKPAGLEFSPIVERSLPRTPEVPAEAVCLDLDSGTYMTNRMFRTDQRATRDWLRTSGADLLCIGPMDQNPVISAFYLTGIEAPAGAWDSMPPEDVGWNWALMRGPFAQESGLAVTIGRPDTFLFRTRENGFGLLQILPATNPTPEVKIRYKLVVGAIKPSRATLLQLAAFGPSNESILGESMAIALDSVQTKVVPASLAERKDSAEKDVGICNWLEREDLDLAFLGHGVFYGSVQDMATLGRDAWNNQSPARLAALLHPNSKAASIKFDARQPGAVTYGFKTRDGRLGLLQSIDYLESPARAKIRFKLTEPITAGNL